MIPGATQDPCASSSRGGRRAGPARAGRHPSRPPDPTAAFDKSPADLPGAFVLSFDHDRPRAGPPRLTDVEAARLGRAGGIRECVVPLGRSDVPGSRDETPVAGSSQREVTTPGCPGEEVDAPCRGVGSRRRARPSSHREGEVRHRDRGTLMPTMPTLDPRSQRRAALHRRCVRSRNLLLQRLSLIIFRPLVIGRDPDDGQDRASDPSS